MLSLSGRWARGIKNELIKEIENSGLVIPPYPVQNGLTAKLRKLAQQHNDHQYATLWAGQSAQASKSKTAKEIFRDLIALS
jgi:nitronate monooxygenase